MTAPRVLLVDPDVYALATLSNAIATIAGVDSCSSFHAARSRLTTGSYDRLVTNLCLGDFNGLHLAYLNPTTRSIVYALRPEMLLCHEIRAAGAFCEWYTGLQYSISSYISSELPPHDRRQSFPGTRRAAFRGGRRTSDVESCWGPAMAPWTGKPAGVPPNWMLRPPQR